MSDSMICYSTNTDRQKQRMKESELEGRKWDGNGTCEEGAREVLSHKCIFLPRNVTHTPLLAHKGGASLIRLVGRRKLS